MGQPDKPKLNWETVKPGMSKAKHEGGLIMSDNEDAYLTQEINQFHVRVGNVLVSGHAVSEEAAKVAAEELAPMLRTFYFKASIRGWVRR